MRCSSDHCSKFINQISAIQSFHRATEALGGGKNQRTLHQLQAASMTITSVASDGFVSLSLETLHELLLGRAYLTTQAASQKKGMLVFIPSTLVEGRQALANPA